MFDSGKIYIYIYITKKKNNVSYSQLEGENYLIIVFLKIEKFNLPLKLFCVSSKYVSRLKKNSLHYYILLLTTTLT